MTRDSVLPRLNVTVDIAAIFILYRLLLNGLGLESIELLSVTIKSCSLVRMNGMGFCAKADRNLFFTIAVSATVSCLIDSPI